VNVDPDPDPLLPDPPLPTVYDTSELSGIRSELGLPAYAEISIVVGELIELRLIPLIVSVDNLSVYGARFIKLKLPEVYSYSCAPLGVFVIAYSAPAFLREEEPV
jgi:hypothetical protein